MATNLQALEKGHKSIHDPYTRDQAHGDTALFTDKILVAPKMRLAQALERVIQDSSFGLAATFKGRKSEGRD
jgi:hypothetical protein